VTASPQTSQSTVSVVSPWGISPVDPQWSHVQRAMRASLAHTGGVISRELASDLRDIGLTWSPVKGDWFVIPDHGLDELEFVVSDMVIETLRMALGRQMLAFNGTTEWAMDTLAASDALWLPREDQLRAILGEAFMALEHLPGETPGYAVSMLLGDTEQRYVDVDPEAAYARAALALLGATDE
jgi:hypothetical protein